MDDGFGIFEITDADGETRSALVRYDKETRYASVSVGDYFSGTQMIGEAAALVNKLFKKCRRAELFLIGYTRPIRLPVKYDTI